LKKQSGSGLKAAIAGLAGRIWREQSGPSEAGACRLLVRV
jgi:hypothetical protein